MNNTKVGLYPTFLYNIQGMKKLIFCDIDGTIVDGTRQMDKLSDKTVYAIKQLCKDNYVFIASGRCKALLEKQITDLNPSGYVLCNGAYAEYNNEMIYGLYFSDEDVKAIRKLVDDYDGFCILETLNNVYVDSFEKQSFKSFMQGWGRCLDGFEEIMDDHIHNDKYHISMIGFMNNDMQDIVKERLKNHATVAIHNSLTSFDINVLGVNKGIGVKKVMEYLGVDYENTYCFGDGINDLEMLQSVAHPVIVKNAHPDLRKYGFEETDDVLDDGFYKYLLDNKLIKPI